MADSSTNLDLISVSQASKEATANALFDAASVATLFGRRASACVGLTWGFYGGKILVNGVITSIANGTVALTASSTNYVEATSEGVVSANTTGFTAGRVKLYTVVTGTSSVTSYTDQRTLNNAYTNFNSLSVDANSTTTAVRITQTGTGNAFVVEDSASTDSTPFVIGNDGRTYVGVQSGVVPGVGYINNLVVAGQDNNLAGISIYDYAATSTPRMTFLYSPSGTVGVNAAVSNGTSVGELRFLGHDGTSFVRAAAIRADIDGTPGTNDMPGRLVFSTTADGASTPTERMRIDSAGRVGIGGTAASNRRFALLGNSAPASSSSSIAEEINITVQPDTTASFSGLATTIATASNGATPYTVTNVQHYFAGQGTFNADSTVTNQFGYLAQNTLIGATNNYGFHGNIPSGTGRWNFYGSGTAANYFNGNTLIGTTTQIGLPSIDSKFEVNEASQRAVTIGRSTANATGAGLNFAKSRSATYGSRAAVSANDVLGTINWYADDGTTLIQGAMVSVEVDGTPGTNDMPTRIEFHTKPSGAGSMTERLRIDSAGQITATGNIAGGYVAHAAGTTAMAFGSYNVVRVTPNATATYTSTVPAAGSIVVLSILTSGTTSYTITFGTGFKSTGTLATGTTSARYFNLTFVSDGTNLIETARTVAIA